MVMRNGLFVQTLSESTVISVPTCFRHSLGLLHTSLKDLLGRDEEDAVAGLGSVHQTQLVHQEVGAAVHVLPADLTQQRHALLNVIVTQQQ